MPHDGEKRRDYESRDRIDQIGSNLEKWAKAQARDHQTWLEEFKADQDDRYATISARLTGGLGIVVVFLVVSLAVAGIALGKAIGRQETLDTQQNRLTRAQAATDSVARSLADVVGEIRDQRISNTRATCRREERKNRDTVGLLRELGATPADIALAERRFPSNIDCEARVDAVTVEPKP